jgi:uncharacterized membrane protein (UPF0127 family)
MRLAVSLVFVACAASLASCGSRPDSTAVDYSLRAINLPDGTTIHAELAIKPVELASGMRFRDSLPAGRGMLFVHDRLGFYKYWMYQVRFPLDIIWLDDSRRVVEIAANCPPCAGPEDKCPTFGGNHPSQFVLELNAGMAARHGVQNGVVLNF